MRTNIIIDDDLMADALRTSGLKTKKAVVDAGLKLLIQTREQTGIRSLRGEIEWEGDLNATREGRIGDL
ncbi:MAG: Arc/MetJ family transcription regulator [Candidatus Latescibacterota bacterium]|jgi:Arc/MetJ family transcription regulator